MKNMNKNEAEKVKERLKKMRERCKKTLETESFITDFRLYKTPDEFILNPISKLK